MSQEPRAKKVDRFLQESESAHDDALRNLQEDVRLAEKFDELEKQSDKQRADPFFYTLRRKRTDAGALTVSSEATSEDVEPVPAEVAPVLRADGGGGRGLRVGLVIALLVAIAGGFALALTLGREPQKATEPAASGPTQTSTVASPTTPVAAASSAAPILSAAPPAATPSEAASAPPPMKTSTHPLPALTSPASPSTQTSAPLGKPPVY